MTMTVTLNDEPATVGPDQIVDIASTVWSSFLGLTLTQVEVAADAEHSATATVHVSGGWNGSVVLSCSATLARRAAAAMFQMAEDDLGDSEVGDAFGELVNMIGGNVKSLLPEPSQLSLPTVSHGAAHTVTVPGARLLEQVGLDCDGEHLQVAVWKQT